MVTIELQEYNDIKARGTNSIKEANEMTEAFKHKFEEFSKYRPGLMEEFMKYLQKEGNL